MRITDQERFLEKARQLLPAFESRPKEELSNLLPIMAAWFFSEQGKSLTKNNATNLFRALVWSTHPDSSPQYLSLSGLPSLLAALHRVYSKTNNPNELLTQWQPSTHPWQEVGSATQTSQSESAPKSHAENSRSQVEALRNLIAQMNSTIQRNNRGWEGSLKPNTGGSERFDSPHPASGKGMIETAELATILHDLTVCLGLQNETLKINERTLVRNLDLLAHYLQYANAIPFIPHQEIEPSSKDPALELRRDGILATLKGDFKISPNLGISVLASLKTVFEAANNQPMAESLSKRARESLINALQSRKFGGNFYELFNILDQLCTQEEKTQLLGLAQIVDDQLMQFFNDRAKAANTRSGIRSIFSGGIRRRRRRNAQERLSGKNKKTLEVLVFELDEYAKKIDSSSIPLLTAVAGFIRNEELIEHVWKITVGANSN